MLLLRRLTATFPLAANTRISTRTLAMSTTAPFGRLVRFHPSSSPDQIHVGEPVDAEVDVGQAVFNSRDVLVNIFSGTSVLEPGRPTGEQSTIGQLLSPLTQKEVGTIRCIGLNYVEHAKEAGLDIPSVPTVFLKPDTALAGPWPQKTLVPKSLLQDDAADHEAEVAVVIGRTCKDVDEQSALSYVLGITAANDVSSRKAQFAQSQWCYSKGFDTSCPIGPALVHINAVKDLSKVSIQGKVNDDIVQKSDLSDLIFSIPKIVSFLSRGTTLPAGTLILTGTPAGIGWTASPRRTLQDGDTFTVTVSNGVGSLINQVEFES
ncbi:hypothetical protein EX895_003642 [Sporisorium graminicola]|uniref:Fumarylacetoacetase-like C-terminal domain-containing protein n=1 Tax=Sporisorium graminicola TaxID=280036 RepID=A0A4U7KR13_9BASI|nr:hypothetical protein EX895_003642 [Sporisorium graminicola]TKY86965.1 hypothetical protein EX895_003642 [Sporisorium graminicola]